MKNSLFCLSFVIAIGFFIILQSCEKNHYILENANLHEFGSNEPKSTDEDSYCFLAREGYVTLTNGRLKFNDHDAMDTVISDLRDLSVLGLDNWENSMGFSSLRSNPTTSNVVANDADVLATLLNQYGILQIDSAAFKVRQVGNDVWIHQAVPVTSESDITDLRNENLNNQKVTLLSHIVMEEDDEGDPTPPVGGNCALSQYKDKQITAYTYQGNNYRFKWKIAYYNSIIYKELSVKIKHDKKVNGIWTNHPAPAMMLLGCSKYYPKNRPCNDYGFEMGYFFNYSSIKKTIYSSTRCLTSYYVSCEGEVVAMGGTTYNYYGEYFNGEEDCWCQ